MEWTAEIVARFALAAVSHREQIGNEWIAASRLHRLFQKCCGPVGISKGRSGCRRMLIAVERWPISLKLARDWFTIRLRQQALSSPDESKGS